MKRLLGSLLGGLFGLLVGPAMAQAPTIMAANWCPIFQMNKGFKPPTAVLQYPFVVGNIRYLCAGQVVQSTGGLFGFTVGPNGGLVVVRGNDPNDIIGSPFFQIFERVPPVGASFYMTLERPAPDTISGTEYYVLADGNPVKYYGGPISGLVGPGQTIFYQITDDGVLRLLRGDPNGTNTLIQGVPYDSVVSLELQSFNYMADQAYFSMGQPVSSASATCDNSMSPIAITCSLALSLNYQVSSSFQWGFKEGLKITQKFIGGLSLPGLAEAKSETGIEIAFEASQTWTDTKTNGQTFTLTLSVPTPPRSVYSAQISGLKFTGNLPYTATGLATYASRRTKVVQSSGIWTGSNTFKFQAVTSCVSTPGGCRAPATTLPLKATSAGVLVPVN
jgi:hypothetical protein